jgi:hypothetical protein
VLLEHTITNPQQQSVKSVLSAHLSIVKDILQTVMSVQPARLRILLALQFVEAAQRVRLAV